MNSRPWFNSFIAISDRRRGFRIFLGEAKKFFYINRQNTEKTKAEIKLRDFIHCLTNINYIVVKKYFFQVEVSSYKKFYLCNGNNPSQHDDS